MPEPDESPTSIAAAPSLESDASDNAAPPLARLIEFCHREVRFLRLGKAEAEDLVQDALVAFLRRSESVENPLAYLRVVLRRGAALVRRANWLAPCLEENTAVGQSASHDPWPVSDLRLGSVRAWRTLPPPDRRLISLICAGHTFAEIGAELGCTSGAARVRAFRIRQKISADA